MTAAGSRRSTLRRAVADTVDDPWGAVRVTTVLASVCVIAMMVVSVPPNRAAAAYWALTATSTAIIIAVLVWLVFGWPSKARRAHGVCAAGLLVVTAALNWAAGVVGDLENISAFYPLISMTVLCLVVMVYRGAVYPAWVVVACIVAMGVVVGVVARIPGWVEAAFPIAMGATFFAISGAVVVLRGMLGEILEVMDRRSVLSARTRRTLEARSRREERIERLAGQVRPVLVEVAAGRPLTEDDLQQARLLELGLRDGIRGAALDVPEIAEAARAARARGVRVTLLDDGGLETAPSRIRAMLLDTIVPLVVSELRALSHGELIVRVMPPGRDTAAIVTTHHADDRVRRVTVGWDGITAPLS